jgi:hypothetical protein
MALGVISVLLALVWLSWPQQPEHVPALAAESSAQLGVPGTHHQAGLPAIAGSQPGPAMAWPGLAKPEFMAATEWASVLHALARDPKRDAELARIMAYRQFQHDLANWRHAMAAKDAGAHQSLAQQLAQQLAQRLPKLVEQRELSGPEALMLIDELSSAFIEQSHADAFRQAALQRLITKQSQQSLRSQADQVADQKKLTSYKQREAQILKQWMALEPTQRNQADLERQLHEARRVSFGN